MSAIAVRPIRAYLKIYRTALREIFRLGRNTAI